MITYIWNFVFNMFGILLVIFISYIYKVLKTFLLSLFFQLQYYLYRQFSFQYIWYFVCYICLIHLQKKDFSLKNLLLNLFFQLHDCLYFQFCLQYSLIYCWLYLFNIFTKRKLCLLQLCFQYIWYIVCYIYLINSQRRF